MKDWKTTLAGLLAGLPTAIMALTEAYNSGYFTEKSGVQLAMGVAFILLGKFATEKKTTQNLVDDIGLPIPRDPKKT